MPKCRVTRTSADALSGHLPVLRNINQSGIREIELTRRLAV